MRFRGSVHGTRRGIVRGSGGVVGNALLGWRSCFVDALGKVPFINIRLFKNASIPIIY